MKLKADLKIWNREVFGFMNLARDKMFKLQELDERDDESDIDEQGKEERRLLLVEHNRFLFKQEAISGWSMETLIHAFLHSIVKWRRARNDLNGVFVDDLWCDDKEVVKDKVRSFFKSQFDGVDEAPVRLDNVSLAQFLGRRIECWSKIYLKKKLNL